MLKKILDYQVLKLQNSTLNWEISRTDLSQIINNPKPTNKEFKNSYLKTPVSDKKSELSKRILDSQLVTSESWQTNSRLSAMKTKILKKDCKNLEMQTERLPKTKVRLPFCHNKSKDSIQSSKKRTMNLAISTENLVKSKEWTRPLEPFKRKSLSW